MVRIEEKLRNSQVVGNGTVDGTARYFEHGAGEDEPATIRRQRNRPDPGRQGQVETTKTSSRTHSSY